MNRKLFNVCNLYVLLFCVFHLKGWLYQQDIISVVVYIIVMLMSAYYTVKVAFNERHNPVIRSYTLMLALFTFYGLINILFFEPIKTSWNIIPTDFYLQNILRSMLPFYAFYYFTKKGYITQKWLCWVAIIFLAVCIPRFYIAQLQAMQLMLAQMTTEEEVTNNAGYFFCALIPLFCFWNKKPIVLYLGFGVCALFVIMAMKRGAILVTAISIIYFFMKSLNKESSRKKLLTVLLFGAFAVFVYSFIQEMFSTSDYFVERYNETLEGNTSSRSFLYADFWKIFTNGDLFSFLFGNGADGTIRLGPNYAHNDWLEIAVNQGLMGVLFFLSFWKSLFTFWKKMKVDTTLYLAYGVCLIQIFVRTFFSMSINDMQIYITLVLGFCVASLSDKKARIKLQQI